MLFNWFFIIEKVQTTVMGGWQLTVTEYEMNFSHLSVDIYDFWIRNGALASAVIISRAYLDSLVEHVQNA